MLFVTVSALGLAALAQAQQVGFLSSFVAVGRRLTIVIFRFTKLRLAARKTLVSSDTPPTMSPPKRVTLSTSASLVFQETTREPEVVVARP